ncbi:MAG: EI24 domain-containing protein [Deltaproteobacteria bacterium]|nr:EI24 domain-containing protein [Deltaproteobacteria bacterium]
MYPFAKTFASINRANLFGLMLICAVLAIILVFTAAAGITWFTARLVTLEKTWLDALVNWLVGAVAGIGGWFMLPVLVVLIAGIFQEVVIRRVEQVDYPEVTRSGAPRFWADAGHDILFTLRALFLNLLVLPLYFLGIGFAVSIMLNSYLLGREFFTGAAGYHLGKPEAALLARKHRKTVYVGGFVITLMTLVPVFNLFMPVFATVWMVHVYHGLKPKSGG